MALCSRTGQRLHLRHRFHAIFVMCMTLVSVLLLSGHTARADDIDDLDDDAFVQEMLRLMRLGSMGRSPQELEDLRFVFGTTRPGRYLSRGDGLPAAGQILRMRALAGRVLDKATPRRSTIRVFSTLRRGVNAGDLVMGFATPDGSRARFRTGGGMGVNQIVFDLDSVLAGDAFAMMDEVDISLAHEGQHYRYAKWLEGHLRRDYGLVPGTAEFERAMIAGSKSYINELLAQRKGFMQMGLSKSEATARARQALQVKGYWYQRLVGPGSPKANTARILNNQVDVLQAVRDALGPDQALLLERRAGGSARRALGMVGSAQLVGDLGGFDAMDRLAESQGFLMAGDIAEKDKLTLSEGVQDALLNNFGRARKVVVDGRGAAGARIAAKEEARARYEWANGKPRGNVFTRTWGWIRYYLPW